MSKINISTMLRVGTILHGTYRIESYLSSGGFGNTYIAKNIEFDETYAIKEFFVKGVCQRDGNSMVVSVSNAENSKNFEQQREKFKKEARRLRRLNNPHIVKVYDLFEENGTAYYVMDYVDGENLSNRLMPPLAPLSETTIRNYLTQILDGLEAIHAASIWHLDIKPANIMVDSRNVVKLIDFGASKQQSTVGGATMSTGISYTNGYAPSEQMAQSYDKFGPWTDFYALGATLYKLLTTQDPPSVSDLSEDETEDKRNALPMSHVSEEMKKLVVWMMQVNRLKRPKNVGEIRKGLSLASDVTLLNDNDVTTITKRKSNGEADDTIVANPKKQEFFKSAYSKKNSTPWNFNRAPEIVSTVSSREERMPLLLWVALFFVTLIGLFCFQFFYLKITPISLGEAVFWNVFASMIISSFIFIPFIVPIPFIDSNTYMEACGAIHMIFVKKRIDSLRKTNPQSPLLKYLPRISYQRIVFAWVIRIAILAFLYMFFEYHWYEAVSKVIDTLKQFVINTCMAVYNAVFN